MLWEKQWWSEFLILDGFMKDSCLSSNCLFELRKPLGSTARKGESFWLLRDWGKSGLLDRMSHNCVCLLLCLVFLFDLPFQQDLWEGSKQHRHQADVENRARNPKAPSNVRQLNHLRMDKSHLAVSGSWVVSEFKTPTPGSCSLLCFVGCLFSCRGPDFNAILFLLFPAKCISKRLLPSSI